MEIICPVCLKNPADIHSYYGYLPCGGCRKNQSGYQKPKETVEMTTPAIKEARKEFKEEIVQPFRGGVVSKEYIEKYGTAGIKATKQEIKNARNVWDDTSYYKK